MVLWHQNRRRCLKHKATRDDSLSTAHVSVGRHALPPFDLFTNENSPRHKCTARTKCPPLAHGLCTALEITFAFLSFPARRVPLIHRTPSRLRSICNLRSFRYFYNNFPRILPAFVWLGLRLLGWTIAVAVVVLERALRGDRTKRTNRTKYVKLFNSMQTFFVEKLSYFQCSTSFGFSTLVFHSFVVVVVFVGVALCILLFVSFCRRFNLFIYEF